MSILSQNFSTMTPEQAEAVGRASGSIKEAGCHFVKIVEAYEIGSGAMTKVPLANGSTVEIPRWLRTEVIFQDASGLSAKYSEFLINKKYQTEDLEVSPKAQNQMRYLCNAVGLDYKTVVARTKTAKNSRGKEVEEYSALLGKEVWITTNTVIEVDKDNPAKVYVKQEVNGGKYFDKLERNTFEISQKLEKGLNKEATDLEAKMTDPVLKGKNAKNSQQAQEKFETLKEIIANKYSAQTTTAATTEANAIFKTAEKEDY